MSSDGGLRRQRGKARRRRQVRQLRRLTDAITWLGGVRQWYEGQIVWKDQRGLMAPDATDLALAHRNLRRIARAPRAARRALGLDAAWLARRRAALALAQQVQTLVAPDLKALVQPVHRRQPANLRRLVALLAAEALCVSGLPASPAAALLEAGMDAAPPLLALLADPAAPVAGQALAAMVLGALASNHEPQPQPQAAPFTLPDTQPWLVRAYAWGETAGLPPDPALVVALLADPDGGALAVRCIRAVGPAHRLSLPPALLRELALSGAVTPTALVALAEAAAAAAPLVDRITQHRPLPPSASRPLRALAERLLIQRLELVATLADLFQHYARIAADAAIVTLLVRFATAMLAVAAISPELQRAIRAALETGLTLPPDLMRAYLALLIEEHARLWPRSTGHAANPATTAAWFAGCQEQCAALAMLLRATGDPALTRRWLEHGVHLRLTGAGQAGRPPDARLLASIVQSCSSDPAALERLVRRVARRPITRPRHSMLIHRQNRNG